MQNLNETTFHYSSNPSANGDKNKVVIYSLRKFMSRCETAAVHCSDTVKEWRRRQQGQKTDEGGGRGTPWTDRLQRAVFALSLPRKQSSRCSLAAGVSLPQQWSLFNEPSMRTCILLLRLSSEVRGDVPPWSTVSTLIAHSNVGKCLFPGTWMECTMRLGRTVDSTLSFRWNEVESTGRLR